jgi:four helix bundle protein
MFTRSRSGSWLLVSWYLVEYNNVMKSYRDLEVYQRAYKLATAVHHLSYKLPKEVQFDLADQIRRASRSIPSNIAEGYGRGKSSKDITSYVRNAIGSNDEMLFNIQFLYDVNLITHETYEALHANYVICGKQLTKLVMSLNQQPEN